MFDFPPTFDVNYYRKSYPEMQIFSDEVSELHYRKYGKTEGRSACQYDRSEHLKVFLQQALRDNHLSALEIGPFDAPFLLGKGVKYFDVLDAEGLKERAARLGRTGKVPDCIDYVNSRGDLSIVNESFDMVFSSHLIEHQPNLIRHLQMVSNILHKGGMYVLCIPDKRYCFDHFLPETTVSDVLQAYVEGRTVHPFQCVIEHRCLTVHNNSVNHWMGIHERVECSAEKLKNAIDEYLQAKGEYIDVHSWQFTPDSFAKIINNLYSVGMTDLSLHRLCQTVWGRLEFVAVLKKEAGTQHKAGEIEKKCGLISCSQKGKKSFVEEMMNRIKNLLQ